MKKNVIQWTTRLIVLGVAIVFLYVGLHAKHQVVYYREAPPRRVIPENPDVFNPLAELELPPPQPELVLFWVGESELVADATFSGVELIDGKLQSTYDRSKPVGRQKCPT